jgi:2-(3-amino-3-carboxypropyl)histidine synthase
MYELEMDRAVKLIKKNKAKKVLIQLPDGLKPKAKEISDFLTNKTDADIFIWLGSNFGSCDIPNVKMDLKIHWGHSKWT